MGLLQDYFKAIKLSKDELHKRIEKLEEKQENKEKEKKDE